MKQSKIPPHVTVSALISDNEEALLLEMENIAEFLYYAYKTVNERLLKYADFGNRGRYLPNQWAPHAGIAVKLTPDTLKQAFAIVQEKFTALNTFFNDSKN